MISGKYPTCFDFFGVGVADVAGVGVAGVGVVGTLHATTLQHHLSDSFPFDGVSYTIVSYEFLYALRGKTKVIAVSGSNIPDNVMQVLDKVNHSETVSFTNIKVSCPSGTRVTKGVSIKLQ